MKKLCIISACLFLFTASFTSCYVNRFDIGKGAQSTTEVHKQNHYFIAGLVPAGVSNPVQMAKGSSDYTVTIVHTFVDSIISLITCGIYTPTTTIVKK
jgi:hypothetical protein